MKTTTAPPAGIPRAGRMLLFIASITIGIGFGEALVPVAKLTLPILIIVLSISLSQMNFTVVADKKLLIKGVAAGIGLNYLLFGALWLGIGSLLPVDEATWAGFVLCAASPPGAGITPFTALLGGTLALSTIASVTGFAAAIIVTPAFVAILSSGAIIPASHVAKSAALLVILPFLFAGLIKRFGMEERASKLHGPAVNIGFAVILASLLGVNRATLGEHPEYLLTSLGLSFLCVLIVAIAMKWCLGRMGVSHQNMVSFVLIATIKNSFFAAATAYATSSGAAAVPGVVLSAVIVGFLLVTDHFRESQKAPSNNV